MAYFHNKPKMTRSGTTSRPRTAATTRSKAPLPVIESFAYLSADIIHDVLANRVLPPVKKLAFLTENSLDSVLHQVETDKRNEVAKTKLLIRNLIKFRGLWGELATPTTQRELIVNTTSSLHCILTLHTRWSIQSARGSPERLQWDLDENAADFEAQKQEINESTSCPIINFVYDRCQESSSAGPPPLHELDFAQNLNGKIEFNAPLLREFLEMLPARFDEISFVRTGSLNVEPYELDFLRSQLGRSKHLTKLTVNWIKFPVKSFLTELVKFVKKPSFEELNLACGLHLDLVTEFYDAWNARSTHTTTKQRVLGPVSGVRNELEKFFGRHSLRGTLLDRGEWKLTGKLFDDGVEYFEISSKFIEPK